MRTVKLSFLSCGFNGVRQTTAGNTHCLGVVRAAVTYVKTSLKLFCFPNAEKRLFAFSLMLDNDCCAVEILWRNLQTDKRILKRSQNTRKPEN